MSIFITGNAYIPDHLNPNKIPQEQERILTRHKGDPWPLKADAPFLTNFSQFFEMDSGKIYIYDAAFDCWRDIKGNIVSNTT